MCCIGCLCLSGSHIALLLWFLVVFLAVLHLTCVIFAAHAVSDVAARRVLRSATRGEFLVPRARLAIRQRRAFSVVGPSIWNGLPLKLRFLLVSHPIGLYKSLKSFFFSRGWAGSASE